MQSRTTVRHHLTHDLVTIIKMSTINAEEGVEEGSISPCRWECKLVTTTMEQNMGFTEKVNIEHHMIQQFPSLGIYIFSENIVEKKNTCTQNAHRSTLQQAGTGSKLSVSRGQTDEYIHIWNVTSATKE